VPVPVTSPDPWGAYAAAVILIEAPGGAVWVRRAPAGVTTGQYPDPEGRPVCVITAHNPHGQVVTEQENASAQDRLKMTVAERGWEHWSAAGGDAPWQHVEDSVAVIGIDEAEVAALGAEFGQDAIFSLNPAERRIVGCTVQRVITGGWVIECRSVSDPGSAA
jgi:hypothetical protein